MLDTLAQLIETHIRPAVQQHRGDIDLIGYEAQTGIVRVRLTGACEGCPLSRVTLKLGILRILQKHHPDIRDVVAVTDQEGL